LWREVQKEKIAAAFGNPNRNPKWLISSLANFDDVSTQKKKNEEDQKKVT